MTELVVIRADREWGLWQGASREWRPFTSAHESGRCSVLVLPTYQSSAYGNILAIKAAAVCVPGHASCTAWTTWQVGVEKHGEGNPHVGGYTGLGKLSSCPGGAKTSLMLVFCGHMAPHLCLRRDGSSETSGSAHAHAARTLQGPSWQAQGSTMQIFSRRGVLPGCPVCVSTESESTQMPQRAIRGQRGFHLHLQAWGMMSTQGNQGCKGTPVWRCMSAA